MQNRTAEALNHKPRRYEPFMFKQFSVAHSKSAMRVGVDGVLIGAWADVDDLPVGGVVLDAGCGCGVIALILAQRCPDTHVIGVDCHEPSVIEATANVRVSPWADRVDILHADVMTLADKGLASSVSLIVSNPPFFVSGINNPDTPRLAARHAVEFGPLSLLAIGERLLKPSGRLAMIAPADMEQEIKATGKEYGLAVRRVCRVVTVEGKLQARVMIELVKGCSVESVNTLVIHDTNHNYTSDYKELTKEFYLKF